VEFDAHTLPAGVYVYRLETSGKVISKKLVVNK
jgi:hypothetical protein